MRAGTDDRHAQNDDRGAVAGSRRVLSNTGKTAGALAPWWDRGAPGPPTPRRRDAERRFDPSCTEPVHASHIRFFVTVAAEPAPNHHRVSPPGDGHSEFCGT